MKRLLFTLLLLPFVFVLISAIYVLVENSYDVVVDLSKTSNVCATIQEAVNPGLDINNPNLVHRVLFYGEGNIDPSQYFNIGDHNVCYILASTKTFVNGYPALDAPGNASKLEDHRLIITWDNVTLNISKTGQTRESVFEELGGFYLYGWRSTNLKSKEVSGDFGGLIMNGIRFINRTDVYHKTVPDRAILSIPFGVNSHSTMLVHTFQNGLMRSDLSKLITYTNNLVGTDNSDIGLIRMQGWLTSRGTTFIKKTGIAELVFGNVEGLVRNPMYEQNNWGLLLGDGINGGNPRVSRTCRRGGDYCKDRTSLYAIRNASYMGGTIEGNQYGNLIITECQRCDFIDMHFEVGFNAKGHSIILGAGIDDTSIFCALDTDQRVFYTTPHTCKPVPNASGVLATRIIGGLIGGDKWNELWDGLAIGPGASSRFSPNLKNLSYISIESDIGNNDINPELSSLKLCKEANIDCKLFSFHQDADAVIDLSRATWTDYTKVPAYERLVLPLR